MRKISAPMFGIIAAVAIVCGTGVYAAGNESPGEIERIVNEAIRPVMEENEVPGMAVAVTVRGKQYFVNYGVASKDSRQKVTENTIFEIGSISKTFTATLASYAQVSGSPVFLRQCEHISAGACRKQFRQDQPSRPRHLFSRRSAAAISGRCDRPEDR